MSKSARFVPTNRLGVYDVVNKEDKDMGQVQNFVVDMQTGRIAFVIVSFGGSLGMGDKWFAMPWDALKWHRDTKKFILDMPVETLKKAPGLDKGRWLEELDEWQKDEDLEWLRGVYSHYGTRPYWY
jgi:sporulation protein YlmC with PRC-barrel domain